MSSIEIHPSCAPDEALPSLDINGIMELLPHRAPILMVEELYNIVPFESACGLKSVAVNEPWFAGHFPQAPVMPGVLQIEAMAQVAGALVVHSLGEEARNKISYFLSVDEARFRKPVLPGHQLLMVVKKIQNRGAIWKFSGESYVGTTRVSNGIFSAMIAEA